MARRTAMSKEPGNVSIAIPDYEKQRTGGGSYLPLKPPAMDKNGSLNQGGGQLKRVSPGVYRNAQGQLVGSRGQQLPGSRPRGNAPIQSAIQGAAQGAGMGFGKGRSITSALQGAQQGAQGYALNNAGDMAAQIAGDAAGQFGGGMQQGVAEGIGAGLGNIGMDRGGNPQWLGQGNGPGSPNDVNPWFGQQNGQLSNQDMAMQLQEQIARFQQMQQKPGQMPQRMQSGYMPFTPGQQGPMQDLMYRYPPGQAPDMGQLFNRMQQQPQQPNTVSGLLQKQRG